MEDIDNGTTDNTNSGAESGTESGTNSGVETTTKSLPTGDSPNKSLDVGEDSGKEVEEGEDPHKTLPTRDHETKNLNESSHETKANDKAYEEPKEEVKAESAFNLEYFDKPEEASPEVTEKASELINGDLNYFDNWITEAEDQKKQNKEQLDAYLKSNVESGNQLAYNSEDFTEGRNRIDNIQVNSNPLYEAIFNERESFDNAKIAADSILRNLTREMNGGMGRVPDRYVNALNELSEVIDRRERSDRGGISSPYDEAFGKLKREVEFAKQKVEDINNNGVTKNTGISAASEQQQINDSLQPAKDRYIDALRSGDTRAIEEAKQNYERVANRVRSEFEGSGAMESEWGIKNKPEVFYPMADLLVSTEGSRSDEPETPIETPATPTRTPDEPARTESTRTESVPEATSSETPSRTEETPSEPETSTESTETETPSEESETPAEETTTETETAEPETTEPETPASSEDAIAKADEAKAAYEEAKKREYEAIHREADETEIAQLAAEAERLRQEWEEAEAEAAALRPREDGEDNPEKPRIGHGKEDRELSKEETLPEWVGGDDPHTSSAGAYWAGAFGDENWSDKVPPKTVQGLIDYANDHHDNPFAMFGMTALMEAGGYDALKAGRDVQEIIASAKEVAANANKAIDYFKNGSVKDGIKSILSAGWSVLKVLGNTVSAAWNVCKSAFSFLRSVFAPISSAISSFLNTVAGYNSVKSMIRDMFGIENTDEVIGEIFGDNSETNTKQSPVNVLNKTGFSVKGGTVTDESGYNKGLKQKENDIASDVCKKTMLYFPYLRKAIR